MAPQTTNRPGYDRDMNDYEVDDFADDPFASSNDEAAKPQDSNSKKRKDANGLGIDEAVAVAKKQRVPNVKLDENRLLSDKGIPKLRRKAGDLKFKGKGHEFSDAARLLSFYQSWLDDLFPKAKFLDALAMVEKTGHKSRMRMARLEWIDEGKPKPAQDENEGENEEAGRHPAKFPARVAPIFQNARGSERPKTPAAGDDLFGDDDDGLYDYIAPPRPKTSAPAPAGGSLFGGPANGTGEPDEDDLEALMAEEAAQRAAPTSIFGGGSNPVKRLAPQDPDVEDDLDALMAEFEAESGAKKAPLATRPKPSEPVAVDDEDDLDALMAEAEAQGLDSATKATGALLKQGEAQRPAEKDVDADEEEAMVEMEGLW